MSDFLEELLVSDREYFLTLVRDNPGITAVEACLMMNVSVNRAMSWSQNYRRRGTIAEVGRKGPAIRLALVGTMFEGKLVEPVEQAGHLAPGELTETPYRRVDRLAAPWREYLHYEATPDARDRFAQFTALPQAEVCHE